MIQLHVLAECCGYTRKRQTETLKSRSQAVSGAFGIPFQDIVCALLDLLDYAYVLAHSSSTFKMLSAVLSRLGWYREEDQGIYSSVNFQLEEESEEESEAFEQCEP